MQQQTAWPTIPFSTVDLSSDNPIVEILNAPKFGETEAVIYKTAASQRALISAAATEVICRALHENGSGVLHTVAPFEAERVIPIFDSWPRELRPHLEFYLMTSMEFYYRLNARGI